MSEATCGTVIAAPHVATLMRATKQDNDVRG